MSDSPEHELTVFSAARRMPPEQRAAYLAEACAGDAGLRQRVEDLLQARKSAATFLETPAGDLLSPHTTLHSRAVPSGKPGDQIGHYVLLEQIGEGGCGTVYLASQEQPVRRQVALKVIKPGMDTKCVIARFEAERQALAMMDHPNIAKVLDAGATDGGRPYFVMELVRGVKITNYCDQHKLSTQERLELFMQVCQAIQHAHQKGIIHRDIKPSNILVTQLDSGPVPKVIDFGIAKATHGKLADQTFFTAFEQFIGTPAYMSPEQAEASGTDVDTRSDIYSLGVLLYELLTGLTPFDAKELLQAGLDEIRRTIREQEPARPSTRPSTMQGAPLADIAKHRKTEAPQLIHLVRGDLDWIVMKALEKDRTRRYETASSLAADIRRHLDHEPVAARPPSTVYRFQKLVRRHRLVFVAAGAIVLALAIGVVISVGALIREHQAHVEADRDRLHAEASAKKAEVEARFLEDMLDGVGPSVAMGSDTTLLKRILDNTTKRIGTDLAQQPEVEAELRYTLGEVYWEIGDLEDAEAMHRQALAIRIKALGPKDPLVAQSLRRLGHVLWRRGRLDEAGFMARAGVNLQRELFGNTNLEVARSLEDLAAILNTQSQAAQAEAALREAVTIKQTLLGDDNLEVADSLDDLAFWLFSRKNKRKEADALAHGAIAIRRTLLGANNLLVTVAALKLQAADLDVQGNSSAEEATLYKLVAAQRKLYGDVHPTLAQSLNTLASVLRSEDKLAESEPIRREALAMQRQLLGDENPEVAQTLSKLGELLIAEQKPAEAEPLYRSALAIRQKIFGDDNISAAGSLSDLGKLLEQTGKMDEARKLYLDKASGTSASAIAAQSALAVMYLQGKGVPQDGAEAANWFRKSAELGNTSAQIELGVLYFEGTQVPKNEDEASFWFRKAAGSGNILAKKTLANCYCAVGRSREALAILAKISGPRPRDTELWLTLAAWQVWFGKEADYELTRQQMMQLAAGTDEAAIAQSAAKGYCLRPSTNAVLLAKALELGRLGVELKQGTPGLPWCQLTLGLAEYRNGQFAEAEQALTAAEQTAGKNSGLLAPARFFRALCQFQRGHPGEARDLFRQAEAQMPPLPQDPLKPVIKAEMASHDVMIGWLTYQEAKSVILGPGSIP